MTPVELLSQAAAEGLRLALVDDQISAQGPRSLLARWAPKLRQYRAEVTAALGAVNDSVPIIEPEIVDDIPRRCWWVMDGRRTFTATYTPAITLAELRAEYPGALILEDDDEEEEAEP